MANLTRKPRATAAAIRVRFELTTRDNLRRVVLALDRQAGSWALQFQLFERPARLSGWRAVADLRVELDTLRQNSNAESAAVRGFTDRQAALALGPAAEDARAAARGEITRAEASQSVREILC